MGSRKFEYNSNPDEGDYTNQDFRDDLTMAPTEEVLKKYTFYTFIDSLNSHLVGMLLSENDTSFELGLPNGQTAFCNKDVNSYATPKMTEVIEFIEQSKAYRLEELVKG
jgi:hypothetical protein